MAEEAGGKASSKINVDNVGVFDVVDLLIDEDNFRLEPNPNQPAALKAMLKRQGTKMVTLAEDILLNGLSAGEFIWVAPDPRPEYAAKYVVCEGNRRVTALKLLNEPALADGTTWAKKFRELGDAFRLSPITQVRGVLYPSVDAARPDVYRRHTNAQDGKGLEDWDPFAQDRANRVERKRRSLSMVVMEHLTNSTIEGLADSLGLRDRTTNADRLLSTFSESHSAQFEMKLRGIPPYIDLGPEPERAEEILWAILRASDVAVDAIKSKAQRLAILKDVLAEVVPENAAARGGQGDDGSGNRSGESHTEPSDGSRETPNDGTGTPSGGGGGTPATPGRNPRRDPLDRKTLAPTDRESTLHVAGVRLPSLYGECRGIDVAARPNAAAMLLRVFLELSCEAYLEHQRVRVPTGRNDWSDIGINLDTKIRKVLDRLDHEKKSKELIDAHAGLSDDHGQSHSIRSLHRAMHDRNHVLDPRQIKMAWQRWHPLLRLIHDAIDGA